MQKKVADTRQFGKVSVHLHLEYLKSFALDIAAVSVLQQNMLLRNLINRVTITCLFVNSFASNRDSRDLDYV